MILIYHTYINDNITIWQITFKCYNCVIDICQTPQINKKKIRNRKLGINRWFRGLFSWYTNQTNLFLNLTSWPKSMNRDLTTSITLKTFLLLIHTLARYLKSSTYLKLCWTMKKTEENEGNVWFRACSCTQMWVSIVPMLTTKNAVNNGLPYLSGKWKYFWQLLCLFIFWIANVRHWQSMQISYISF